MPDNIRTTVINLVDPLGHTFTTRILSTDRRLRGHRHYEDALREFYSKFGLEVVNVVSVEEMSSTDFCEGGSPWWQRISFGPRQTLVLMGMLAALVGTDVFISMQDRKIDEAREARITGRMDGFETWERRIVNELSDIHNEIQMNRSRVDDINRRLASPSAG